VTTARPERQAIISGVGRSAVGRRLGRASLELTLDACLAAIDDAGLQPSDIDGLTTWPDIRGELGGFVGPSVAYLQQILRLDLSWHLGAVDGGNVLGVLGEAALAVSAGLARHVLVYRTLTEATAHAAGQPRAVPANSGDPWLVTYGIGSVVQFAAMWAQHHFHRYGTTREQLAWVALNDRRHAALNPDAIFRDPLTIEDYLAARMISDPLGLFDCDIPSDGAHAFVVSHRDHHRDADAPVFLEAMGVARPRTSSWAFWPDLDEMAAHGCARQLWSRTTLGPQDVDVAGLYDGFSIFTLLWLEALGFCGRGESGPFVEGGDRIGLGGELPLNTSGGQLSEGRYVGFGFVHEICQQLRNRAGDRQVTGAEVGLVAGGGGPLAQAFLFTNRT
jgi:acetyl-CoA acetyltransferase